MPDKAMAHESATATAAPAVEAPLTEMGSNTEAQDALLASGSVGAAEESPVLAEAERQLPTPGQRGTKKPASPTATKATPPTAPAAAGPNDLALSVDAKYASKGYVPWFAGQVKNKITPWGLAFDAKAVRLASDVGSKGTTGIVLAWSNAWGDKPSTSPVPLSMTPIDAKAGTKATKALSGWTKVEASNQTRLDALLGGETNARSAKARDKLRGDLATIKTKSDTQQAKALEDLLTDKAAKPDVINTKVEGAPSPYTLTGPTEKKAYAFRGKTADAEQWACKFKDGQEIAIIAPKAPEPGHHYHTVQQAAEAASKLPAQSRKVVTSIVLNPVVNPDDAAWAVKYNRPNFHSYMTAGVTGQITIYPDKKKSDVSSQDTMNSSMVHETGHTWSYKTWGTDTTKGKWLTWKKAMAKDKASLSNYADASISEDVAETVQAYGSTKGTPKGAEYRKIVPARFTMLDAEYK